MLKQKEVTLYPSIVLHLIWDTDFLKHPPHNNPVHVRQIFGY